MSEVAAVVTCHEPYLWWLPEVLCYLTHLEREGRVRRVTDPPADPERWGLAAAGA